MSKELFGKLLLPVVGGLLTFCCADAGDSVVAPPPDIPRAVLQAAPDTIVVQGRSLTLSAFLWRDFMPISPPDGKPLVAIVTITALDTARLPASISCDVVWIVYSGEIWKAWLQREASGNVKPNQMSLMARDGPKWGPNVFVDVIVRVSGDSGQARLLRAPRQWIGRTD
jgi:hypothetical protein